MGREMLLVDRRRATLGFVLLMASLLAAAIVLVYAHGRAVAEGDLASVATELEVAAGIVIVAMALLAVVALTLLRRSFRLTHSLQRAIHRDRTQAYEGRSDMFAEFGELGAAIGAYGRALERRGRVIVGRLGATERALRQVVAAIGEDVLVLDGTGRIFAASSSAERLIESDSDGTRRVVSDPPLRTVLRSLLAKVSHDTISVAKTTMYVSPVYVDRSEGDRRLAFLVLTRKEPTRPVETEFAGTQKTGNAGDRGLQSFFGRLLSSRHRR